MSSVADRLKKSVLNVTKAWAKQRKAEERHASAEANRRDRLTRVRYHNFRSAAFQVMEQAYLVASANGRLPALARQVMYQARPLVQDLMGGQQLNDQYFCQQLLPDYIEVHGVAWDVVYDDRGHFAEPHAKREIGLGTLAVRSYLKGLVEPKLTDPSFAPGAVLTHGPDGCFDAVLFVEKEGFVPLFEAVHLAERYDLGIMSTKGMSNTAARQLVDEVCGKRKIPLFVLHDFDKSGLSILATLREDTRRYEFLNHVEVIDLGLRLEDVVQLGLQAERAFDKGKEWSRRENLRQNGATDEEIEFLLTQRVELNAMSSDQLVAFVERKLIGHSVEKVVPDDELLTDAYRLAARNREVKKIVRRVLRKLKASDATPPSDLAAQVRDYLKRHPRARWDEAVNEIEAGRVAL
jgi:hypothetical protein